MSGTAEATIKIDFTCESADSLRKLFGVETDLQGSEIEIGEGTTVVLDEVMDCAGMTGKEILVTVVISIATGIPSGIAANWVYDNVVNAPQVEAVQVEGERHEFKAVADVEQVVDLARK